MPLIAKPIRLLLALVILAFSLSAQSDYKSFVGKWNMTSETDGDPVHWTLVLKDTDGKAHRLPCRRRQRNARHQFFLLRRRAQIQSPLRRRGIRHRTQSRRPGQTQRHLERRRQLRRHHRRQSLRIRRPANHATRPLIIERPAPPPPARPHRKHPQLPAPLRQGLA